MKKRPCEVPDVSMELEIAKRVARTSATDELAAKRLKEGRFIARHRRIAMELRAQKVWG